jgi:transcriptional regulator with XRE-family HTH domain
MSTTLFPALLRYWRKQRGLSQLDLAVEAEVSARHVSFLETGRARPSAEMVLRLLSALSVPLRAQNEALRAAGCEPRFPEPGIDALEPELQAAIAQMMAQHEPFPLTVLGGDFRVLRSNRGAQAFFRAFCAEPELIAEAPDMFSLFFDPRLVRPFVIDWPRVAFQMLSRLQRELLQRSGDERLQALLARIMAYPDLPDGWREPDFSVKVPATQSLRVARSESSLGFLVTVTKFSAPQQVLLEELSIESCFPLDDATRATCERLTAG